MEIPIKDLKCHQWTPNLSDEQLKRIRTVWEVVRRGSLEHFEFGFTCDMHPNREIAIWERYTKVVARAVEIDKQLDGIRNHLAIAVCVYTMSKTPAATASGYLKKNLSKKLAARAEHAIATAIQEGKLNR